MPLVALGIGSLVGGLGGAAISANAAGHAADTQAQAANQAAQLQYQSSQNALDFQKYQYGQNQANLAPWLNMGRAGLANLSYLSGLLPQSQGTSQSGQGMPTPGAPSASNPNLHAWGMPDTVTNINAGGENPGRPAGGMQPGMGGSTAGAGGPYSNLQTIANMGDVPGTTMQLAPGGAPGAPGTPGSTSDLSSMVNPSLGASGSLLQGWNTPFVAPTNVTEQNDPGYQFRLQQGTDALQRSAAASGNLFTGGTGQALEKFGQDYASNEYGNVYNRAMGQYAQNYNIFENNQANTFNRLAAISGIGQTTANQLGNFGQQAASNIGNIDLSSGAQIGQQLNNAAAARGSGYVGAANAYGGALSGIPGNLMNLYLLNNMLNSGGGGAPPPVPA